MTNLNVTVSEASPPPLAPVPRLALRIAVWYAVLGCAWILLSGWLLHRLVRNPEWLAALEDVKGWCFILVTALLLWFALDRYFRELEAGAQRVQDLEQRWKFALEGAGHGVWDWDLQTNKVFFSDRWKTMLGFEPEEVGGALSEWETRVHPEDLARVKLELQRHLARQAEEYVTEYRLRCKDGSYKWIQDRGKVMARAADGRALRFLGTHFDISDRRAAEEVLRQRLELQDQLANIAATVPGMICSFRLRPDGAVSMPFATPAIEQLYGVHPEDVREDFSTVFSRIVPEDLGNLQKSIAESARTMSPWRDTFCVRHPQKGELWVEGHSVPHREPDGSILWHGFVQDVTERRRTEQAILESSRTLEQRVKERTAELRAANQELDAFSYAVSHDLRAPLRAMSGFSHALLEDYGAALPEAARGYLEEIKLGSRQMGELIDGLLRLSRCTLGELRCATVDISGLAGEILCELSEAEPERGVIWTVEPGLSVRGDPGMLKVVLTNLLENAWKYTARTPQPKIRVHGCQDGPGQSFCIADNGAGFDMKYAARLFQPFQRLHREEEFPGIGIGLATVQRIVHRHGGEIRADATPGRGATFGVILPSPGGDSKDKS